MSKIDFAGRLKKIWGERGFSDQEVAEMRMAEFEGSVGILIAAVLSQK